jgi:hypothetical protein
LNAYPGGVKLRLFREMLMNSKFVVLIGCAVIAGLSLEKGSAQTPAKARPQTLIWDIQHHSIAATIQYGDHEWLTFDISSDNRKYGVPTAIKDYAAKIQPRWTGTADQIRVTAVVSPHVQYAPPNVCLTAWNPETPGAEVYLDTCTELPGTPSQAFDFEKLGGDRYKIILSGKNLCLGMRDPRREPAKRLYQADHFLLIIAWLGERAPDHPRPPAHVSRNFPISPILDLTNNP